MAKQARPNIVAIETNLVGRRVTARYQVERTGWPFETAQSAEATDTVAEVVGAYVGDLQEGGEVKLLLHGLTTHTIREAYARHVNVAEEAGGRCPATPEQIERAREEHGSDEINIDSDAEVSDAGEEGYWVQAWVWLPADEDDEDE